MLEKNKISLHDTCKYSNRRYIRINEKCNSCRSKNSCHQLFTTLRHHQTRPSTRTKASPAGHYTTRIQFRKYSCRVTERVKCKKKFNGEKKKQKTISTKKKKRGTLNIFKLLNYLVIIHKTTKKYTTGIKCRCSQHTQCLGRLAITSESDLVRLFATYTPQIRTSAQMNPFSKSVWITPKR